MFLNKNDCQAGGAAGNISAQGANSPEHRAAVRKTAEQASRFLPFATARDFAPKHSETKRPEATINGN
jgi:hypothetical protein